MTPRRSSRRELAPLFEGADYLVDCDGSERILRIGVAAAWIDDLLARHRARGAAIVTGWNPGGVVAAPEANRAANVQLAAVLATAATALVAACGASPDRAWREDGFLAVGIARRRARAIARAFGQAAIVWCARGRPPKLEW